MQNYIFKSTTLLITVKDQVKFTKQLIKFLNSQPITINIFVADGSKNKQKQLFKKLKHKYRYFYYGEDKYMYEMLKADMLREDTVYQFRRQYVRENKSNVCPTLTANMGTGGHNVPLIKTKFGFRKLTPKECFDFQGFPKSFKLPQIANSHLYKQAGNSVSMPVIERITKNILKSINGTDCKNQNELDLF